MIQNGDTYILHLLEEMKHKFSVRNNENVYNTYKLYTPNIYHKHIAQKIVNHNPTISSNIKILRHQMKHPIRLQVL